VLPAVFLFARQMPGFRHFYFAPGRAGIAILKRQSGFTGQILLSRQVTLYTIPLPCAGNGLSAPFALVIIIKYMAKKRKSEGGIIT
jgi:hypothetical protein